MKYGLIGEKLGHSYSKEIHAAIADYDYEICEIAPDKLDEFLKKKQFSAINVTIPYKQSVITYLDSISPEAESIGAVNTVVNKDGRLYGYNTDFYGMKAMLEKYGIVLKDKKVLILGTGGTSKTANAVAKSLGAGEILTVSRRSEYGKISYAEALEKHSNAQIIINTTPVGMYPNVSGIPIDISKFPKLEGIADAVYNPTRTNLVCEGVKRNIPSCGGLYMLAAQAVYASALFLGKEIDEKLTDKAFRSVEFEKQNIVLIGMPSAGKSTVGKIISDISGKEFFDSDDVVTPILGMPINDFFAKYGEEPFRSEEKKVISELSKKRGCVIATGGGVPLFSENMDNLRRNAVIVFLDRSPAKLIATPDRPLSRDPEKLMQRYRERYGIYKSESDIQVDADGEAEEVARAVLESLK